MDQQQLDYIKDRFRLAFGEKVRNGKYTGKEVNEIFTHLWVNGLLDTTNHVVCETVFSHLEVGEISLVGRTDRFAAFRQQKLDNEVMIIHPLSAFNIGGKVSVNYDKDGIVYTGYVVIGKKPVGFAYKPAMFGFTPYVATKDQSVRYTAIPLILNLVDDYYVINQLNCSKEQVG